MVAQRFCDRPALQFERLLEQDILRRSANLHDKRARPDIPAAHIILPGVEAQLVYIKTCRYRPGLSGLQGNTGKTL